MSDEFDARRAMLTALSEPGGPLTIDAPHATINDRRYFRMIDGEPTPTRARHDLHTQILTQWQASQSKVRRERVAVLMAGPPGAGKSTAQTHLLGERIEQYRRLDADEFKRQLLEYAVANGTLQEMLPPELRSPAGEPARFYPNELSALVHRESSLLLETAVEQSIARGENVIIDGTLAWKPWAVQLVTDLDRKGYSISIADVEAPHEVASERIVQRWQEGHLAALSAPETDMAAQMGGRWVPQSAVDRLFPIETTADGVEQRGKSVSQSNAQAICEMYESVLQYDMYWTEAADRGAELFEQRRRNAAGEMETTFTARLREAEPEHAKTAALKHAPPPRTQAPNPLGHDTHRPPDMHSPNLGPGHTGPTMGL